MEGLKEKFQISEHFSLKEYDNYMKQEPLEQKIILDFIIDKVTEKKNIKLLEFGAGTGRFTKLLLRVFPKINLTLIEPDKNCCIELNKLKQKYKQIKVVQSTAEDFKSNIKYDVIVMATAFHHVPFNKKIKFFATVKRLLKANGLFLMGDNFIAEYNTMKQRNVVLQKSIDKWINDSKKERDAEELAMALKLQKIVFRKDFGGEYFICPSVFESYVKKAKLRIKGNINVTNTDPYDMENYFYLITQ